MKYLSPQFYVKSTSDNGHIEGYASVFNVKDEQGDTVLPGAFKKALANFEKNGKMPKMLWQHDARKPIGVWEEIREDEHGLFVKGKLLLDLKRGREAWSLLKNRAIDGLSIGYRSTRSSITRKKNMLSDIDLLEISIVTFPACADAIVESVKSDAGTELKNKDLPLDKDDKSSTDTANESTKSVCNSKNMEDSISSTDKQIDAFAELIKVLARLTQMIYQLVK